MLTEAVFATLALTPRVVLEIDSIHSAVDSIRRKLGITVLPESSIAQAIAADGIHTREFTDPPVLRPMYLLRRHSPALTAAAQVVYDIAKELVSENRMTTVTMNR